MRNMFDSHLKTTVASVVDWYLMTPINGYMLDEELAEHRRYAAKAIKDSPLSDGDKTDLYERYQLDEPKGVVQSFLNKIFGGERCVAKICLIGSHSNPA